MQSIDSSEGGDTLFFKSAPESDLNQLPLGYGPKVQTTTLSLHNLLSYLFIISLNINAVKPNTQLINY